IQTHYLDIINFFERRATNGSPDKSGGKFFNSIENLHLCTMNNQGLLALAQLILPSEILSNFEVVRVEEEASLIRIYLDESVKAEYKENPEIESKGFCEAVTIRDFPIRDKGVDLIVRRRKWYDKQNNRYFSDSYDLKAEETRYSKEFAAFLKGVYGDDSYDLPFA
ncbi:ISAon1 family transposase N-terminal region protein, partial [Phocaeicola vulgatus]|uniref:ISAon1 family transposase N-terminal region protein n=1 Tax=Phocaeicola vulgatus TaxID=821 RepID=UPI003D730E27